MGAGIAQVCAQAGWPTHLVDAQPAARERALAAIHGFWQRGIEKGKHRAEDVAAWKEHLDLAPDLDAAVRDASLVIEAVPEDLALKKRIFGELDSKAPAGAILASNTSSLSIAAIAAATARPGRVLGMHFFNPVPLMQLLELVRHDGTDETVLARARDIAQAMGKTCIVARDRPGFATSRLGIVLGNEAARMLEEGVASAQDIDTAMRLGYGHPMGPLELSDLVGLDVRHAITQYLHRELGGAQWQPPAITQRLVARGELGKKTGKGFYDWTSGKPVPRDLEGA
jgi:3-hydroxybutyryl-CoA dehydrogenase